MLDIRIAGRLQKLRVGPLSKIRSVHAGLVPTSTQSRANDGLKPRATATPTVLAYQPESTRPARRAAGGALQAQREFDFKGVLGPRHELSEVHVALVAATGTLPSFIQGRWLERLAVALDHGH